MNINFTTKQLMRILFAARKLSAVYICITLLISANYSRAQTSEPYNWSSVAIGGGGFVSAIITEKTQGTIYARTDVGGAYRFDRANSKWIPLMDWASDQQQGMFGTESLAIDPQNPNIVYVLAGISYFNSGKTYMLRSTDYGANFAITEVTSQFKAHGNGMGRHNGEKLQVDPNNSSVLYCGTRWNGLFKSTNSGSTWSRVSSLNVTTTPNENGISFVVLDKSSVSNGTTQRIFAGISRTGSDQNLYMSNDGGSTFTAIVNSNLGAGLMPQRAALADDGNLYVTYGNGAGPHGHWAVPEDYSTGQVWKYNIASNTWINITPEGFTRPFSGICVDPANPQRLMLSTTNHWMLQGTAYGDRYFITTSGGIRVDANTPGWKDVIATNGFTMDANGVSWIGEGQAIHWSGSIEFDPLNTNKVFVTSGNGVFVNEDVNTSRIWKFMAKGVEETVPTNIVSIPGGPLLSVIRDYDGFRHTDLTQYAPIHTPRIGSTSGLDYAAAIKTKVIRVGGENMYYSNDMGSTWTKTTSMNGSSGQVALSANGATILHCPDGSTITYRSTDNGNSWSTVTGLNISNARPVADPVNSSKFYAFNNSTGAMMVSNDGGSSFSAAGSLSGGSKIIRTVPGREGHIWVALDGGGLSRSTNSGVSFQSVNNGGLTYCGAVGIGKASPSATYETIYIYGTVSGAVGVYRSTNEGATWTRVNDEDHEYGGPGNGSFVYGDMNVYGRVYMSTAGRGIVYGESAAPVTNYLTVTPANLTYTSAASSQSVNVSSDMSWTATANQSWISVSPASGSNNGTVAVSVTQNTGSARTGTVTIAGGGVTNTVNVTQNAACTPSTITPYLLVGNGRKYVQTSTATVSAGSKVRLAPQAGSGGSWSWIGPNGYTASIREITLSNIQANQSGDYIVTYTNTSGCQSSLTFTITVTGGATAFSENNQLSLNDELTVDQQSTALLAYPNPVENKVTITVAKDLVGAKIVLTTLNGSMVYGGTITQVNSNIDMSQMPAGLYILTVKGNGRTLTSKILKK